MPTSWWYGHLRRGYLYRNYRNSNIYLIQKIIDVEL